LQFGRVCRIVRADRDDLWRAQDRGCVAQVVNGRQAGSLGGCVVDHGSGMGKGVVALLEQVLQVARRGIHDLVQE
jgi:hypothetical protein